MDRWRIRSAAIGCAFASCAMIAGPGIGGVAIAHAGIFGIGPDLLDPCGDKKSDMHHPRPGSDGAESARTAASPATTASSRGTASIASAEAPTAKVGSQPETLSAPAGVADNRSLAGAVGNVDIAGSNLGGGGLARTGSAAVRAGNVPRVSTAPVTRSVVIRGTPHEVGLMPGFGAPSLPEAPVVAPLAAPPPVPPDAEALPAPGAPPAPTITVPQAKEPLGQHGPGAVPIPGSYRAGYAEYLRAADTSDLVAAALPGVAGIAGFTLIGAYAGYRQARSVRRALLAPAPTSILL